MKPIDQPIKDKIILITGGASGIGLALTKQSYELGAKVLVADIRTTPDFDSFARGKDSILYVQSDVTRWSDFEKLFSACENKWNDVPDAYGICAGLFEPSFSSWWLDTELQDGYQQVDVNINHPIKLTRLAIKKSLGRGKRASVCIIASMAGLGSAFAAPLYCATKYAIVGFVRSMKDVESVTGVKVTTICPAFVNTPLVTADKKSQFSYSEDRVLSPDKVAMSMTRLLQEKEYGCGTVLEISVNSTRLIPEWNVSPPPDAALGRDIYMDPKAISQAMWKPIIQVLDSEKNALKS